MIYNIYQCNFCKRLTIVHKKLLAMPLFNNVLYVSLYNVKHDCLPFSLILLYILLIPKDVVRKKYKASYN